MENTLIIKRLKLAQDYTELLDREGYHLVDMNMVEPFYIEDKEHHPSTIIFERNEQLMSIRSDWTRSLLNYNENFYLSQGYDLTPYAGKTVMRYVYRITNYPGATEPVYATLLVYRNEIIGGDVTDTAAKGIIHGFKMPTKSASV